LKFRVDSERGKRNIRHLATVSESRVALLFNNLSDNLCGHSKISTACRFFDPRLASSITMRGHAIMRQTKALIEAQGYDVIYGDT
ncbi:hypothetical protein ONJ23_25845, partial [Salmonella enterica subsp. enterica serovar Virginia]|nr:hypothetical protein [Salmonella enterica subsp. enterica serovar Virginia]